MTMPRKRRRTAFLAVSESSGIAYSPTATRAHSIPDPTNPSTKYLRISHSGHSLQTPHPQQTCRTPTHSSSVNPKPTPTFSRFQLCSAHIETNDDIVSADSRASPARNSSFLESDPIINHSPFPLHPPSKRSAKHRLATPANLTPANLTPAPQSVPISTPPTALVARSLLDAMNQTLPLPLDTPDHEKAVFDPQATPLLLGNSAIRSAQQQLGMTPTSPTSELVPIPGSVERQLRHAQMAARRLCFSGDANAPNGESDGTIVRSLQTSLGNLRDTNAKDQESNGNVEQQEAIAKDNDSRDCGNVEAHHPNSTPLHTRRRLSGVSAVTPIPICFESPLIAGGNDDSPSVAKADIGSGNKSTNACLASQQGDVASPITPQRGIDFQGAQIHVDPHPVQLSQFENAGHVSELPSAQKGQEQQSVSAGNGGLVRDGKNLVTFAERASIELRSRVRNANCADVASKFASGAPSPSIANRSNAHEGQKPDKSPVKATPGAGAAISVFTKLRERDHLERGPLKVIGDGKENKTPLEFSRRQTSVHQTDSQGNPSSTIRRARNSFRPSMFTKANGNPVQLPETGGAPTRNVIPSQFILETDEGLLKNRPQPDNACNSITIPVPRREEARLASSLFTTGKGNPVRLPTSHSILTPASKANAMPSLFTTGRGIPIGLPPTRKDVDKSVDAPFSLFVTGKGRPVQVSGTNNSKSPCFSEGPPKQLKKTPADPAKPPQALPFQPLPFTDTGVPRCTPLPHINRINNFGNINPPPKSHSAQGHFSVQPNALFSTGSGKKLLPTKQPRDVSALTKDIESLFTNGLGKAAADRDLKKDFSVRTPARIKSPDTARPRGLRGTPGRLLPARMPQIVRSGTPIRNSTRKGVSPGLRTTPFKRPRQICRPKSLANSGEANKLVQCPVPKLHVPALLKTGSISCRNAEHACRQSNSGNAHRFDLRYRSAGGFRRCHECQLQAESFGNISCLPTEVVNLLNLRQKTVFGVKDCIEWIRKWFPTMTAKPASFVGSEAWTRMSYALAVWKLSRLNEESDSREASFLSASNIIREILRRISYEWHKSMQPHLLRIMRRDSAPASHTVLIVIDIEMEDKQLILLLSDGWYVARARIDKILQERVQKGKIRIGEKIHISGANLQACSSDTRAFFFGDGDELGRSVLTLSANNVQKRCGLPFERLGIQRTGLVFNKLRGVRDECGVCPPALVVVLRSYPVYFMERTDLAENDKNGEKAYRFLREDAEYEARVNYADRLRQTAVLGQGVGKAKPESEFECSARDVSSIKEVVVCGKCDDVNLRQARKLVRIYNPTEDLQASLSTEGGEFLMGNLWPKRNVWIGKPEGIRPLRKKGRSPHFGEFPRRVYSIQNMQSGEVERGQDFDGVFCLLHVADEIADGNHRFVYFIDAAGSHVGILALELNDSDSRWLPKIFRRNFRRGGTRFPLVALRDVEFQTVSPLHNLVHAQSSMRSSFLSSASLRQQKYERLHLAVKRLESELRGKDDQLEVLREAVVSFASGVRASVGAYFTSTQDM